jgi:hypothetical protein
MNNYFVKFRFAGVVIVLATMAVFSAVAMALWNSLMPDIFGLPALQYWQAAGIFLLCRILFGGIGRGSFLPWGMRRGDRDIHHGNPLREKWMSMSEGERNAFIEKEKELHNLFHDRFSWRQDFCNEQGEKDGRKEAPASSKGAADA